MLFPIFLSYHLPRAADLIYWLKTSMEIVSEMFVVEASSEGADVCYICS